MERRERGGEGGREREREREKREKRRPREREREGREREREREREKRESRGGQRKVGRVKKWRASEFSCCGRLLHTEEICEPESSINR